MVIKWFSVFIGVVLFFFVVASAAADEHTAKAHPDRSRGPSKSSTRTRRTLPFAQTTEVSNAKSFAAMTLRSRSKTKPGGSMDDLKEAVRVICLGKFNERSQLAATRIDIRAAQVVG